VAKKPTDDEKAQLARFDEHWRVAPLDQFQDDPIAIKGLLDRELIERKKGAGRAPAMYRLKRKEGSNT